MKRRQQLDEDESALHDRWDSLARVIALVLVTTLAVWAVVAGLRLAVHWASDRLLEEFEASHAWWMPAALGIVIVFGGLLRGLLNRRPGWSEAASDGIDVALENYHCTYGTEEDDPTPRYRRQAFRLALRKATATLLTLGTGGSGGLEGPSVLVGESVGAGVARFAAARSEHELRTYQLAGIAAGVGTLLSAPFAAALFAIEVVYGNRIAYRKLAYCLLASIVTYSLNNHFLGFKPLFQAPPHAPVYTLREYAFTALVAVTVSAPVALAFGLAMKHTRELVERVHPVLRGAAGGLGTALVALSAFWIAGIAPRHILGMGDGTVRDLLARPPDAHLGTWWVLVAIVAGKLLATGFTVQSGGSAGMLIPSMVLGGVAGAATARIFDVVGIASVGDPSLFVVVGIASALVAVVGVPLSAIALVLEMFGSPYGPPTVLACGLTYVLTLRLNVYASQPKDRQTKALPPQPSKPPAARAAP